MDVAQNERGSGRRFRFWVVATFALANVAAWLAYHRFYGPASQRLLRVERFSPDEVPAAPKLIVIGHAFVHHSLRGFLRDLCKLLLIVES